MERCGFFDANLVGEEYDRVYLASQFAAYFASFIGNGVFAKHSNQLQVVEMETPQMQVGVERGQAWINGYWYENTDIFYLPIDVADGVLNRIDSVVLRFGLSERNIWLTVKKGTPAMNPVAPKVTRNADYYELQLATISIPAGSIKITQAQITDTRMNNDVCGWVTGVIDQVDTTTLFIQYVDWYTTTTGQAEIDIEAIKQQFQSDINQFLQDWQNWYTQTTQQAETDINSIIQQFQNDLTQFEQDWNDWFSQQQTEELIMAIEKGQPNGVATLDENGKVPDEQLPEIEIPVTSVNGKTGDVVLTVEDIGAETPTGAQVKADAALVAAKQYTDQEVGEVENELMSHKNDKVAHIDYAVASGTNTYTVNVQGIASLTEGLSIKIKFINANTGASTLNINGLGAKEIRKSNGNTLSSGNIKAGQICHLVYTGSVFQLLGEGGEYGTAQPQHVLEGYTIGTEEGIKEGTMSNYGNKTFIPSDSTQTSGAGYYNSITVNPRPTLSGNASTSHVLNEYTFYSNNYTKRTGTMPNQGAKIFTPSTINQAIVQGYHNGQGYVKGDANLVAGNIRAGVSIFGVSGNPNVVNTSGGDAVAGNILAGKKAYVAGSLITGTMPNRGAVNSTLPINGSYTIPAGYHNGSGKVTQSIPTQGAQTITPGTSDKTIPSGRYLTGTQTIKGDANLIPANILAGKSIFGVAGSVIAGKRFASGSISSSSFATMTFMRIFAGSSLQLIYDVSTPTMVVTGLNFTPSMVMAVSFNGSTGMAFAFYFSGSPIVFCGDSAWDNYNRGRVSMQNGFTVSGGPNPVIVTNGFNLPISNPTGSYTNYTWYAWE